MGFAVSVVLLRFSPPVSSVPPLALVVVVSTISCTAYGLALGAIAMRARRLRAREPRRLPHVDLLRREHPALGAPGWMATIGRGLPMTHGIAAARELAAGRPLGAVTGKVLAEVAVAAARSAAAYALFRLFELEGRRRASLETY